MTFKISYVFLLFVVILLVHQYIFYNVWFQPQDIHHETWMIMFGFAGLVLLVKKK